MATAIRIIVGLLLAAHGLVHLLYLSEDTPEFRFQDSWLVPASASRSAGLGLMTAAVVAFGLLGLAVWGVPGLSSVWPALTIAASGISILLLGAFWHPRLVFGIAIDLALIAIAVLRPGWTERLA